MFTYLLILALLLPLFALWRWRGLPAPALTENRSEIYSSPLLPTQPSTFDEMLSAADLLFEQMDQAEQQERQRQNREQRKQRREKTPSQVAATENPTTTESGPSTPSKNPTAAKPSAPAPSDGLPKRIPGLGRASAKTRRAFAAFHAEQNARFERLQAAKAPPEEPPSTEKLPGSQATAISPTPPSVSSVATDSIKIPSPQPALPPASRWRIFQAVTFLAAALLRPILAPILTPARVCLALFQRAR